MFLWLSVLQRYHDFNFFFLFFFLNFEWFNVNFQLKRQHFIGVYVQVHALLRKKEEKKCSKILLVENVFGPIFLSFRLWYVNSETEKLHISLFDAFFFAKNAEQDLL